MIMCLRKIKSGETHDSLVIYTSESNSLIHLFDYSVKNNNFNF